MAAPRGERLGEDPIWGVLRDQGITQAFLWRGCGMDRVRARHLRQGGHYWYWDEVRRISERLGLPWQELFRRENIRERPTAAAEAAKRRTA